MWQVRRIIFEGRPVKLTVTKITNKLPLCKILGFGYYGQLTGPNGLAAYWYFEVFDTVFPIDITMSIPAIPLEQLKGYKL